MKYDELRNVDILVPRVVQEIRAERFGIKDGKIVSLRDIGLEVMNPWIFEPGVQDRKCERWGKVYFGLYGMISRGCFNCWKVVCRPKTLKELLGVRKVQKRLGLAAKCGLEVRPGSRYKGLYAGFWYAPLEGGLEGARKLHKLVEREVHEEVGFQVRVSLKRACTEMEEAAGPTDRWVFPEVQYAAESYLDSIWEVNEPRAEQPEFLKVHILKEWMEHAWENRDESVKEFIPDPGRSLGISGTVTYEEGTGTAKEQPARVCERERGEERPEVQGLSDYV